MLTDCSSSQRLKKFKSDGCSMFPDSSWISDSDWCDCCFEHDIIYYGGGTKQERKAADKALRDCVRERSNRFLAGLMYLGVHMGGTPYFPTWYRWGFGWKFGRGYKLLTPEEMSLIRKELEDYFNATDYCIPSTGSVLK